MSNRTSPVLTGDRWGDDCQFYVESGVTRSITTSWKAFLRMGKINDKWAHKLVFGHILSQLKLFINIFKLCGGGYWSILIQK